MKGDEIPTGVLYRGLDVPGWVGPGITRTVGKSGGRKEVNRGSGGSRRWVNGLKTKGKPRLEIAV